MSEFEERLAAVEEKTHINGIPHDVYFWSFLMPFVGSTIVVVIAWLFGRL